MDNNERRFAAAAIATVLLLPAGAWACSCMPYPADPQTAVDQAWKQADTIVTAQIMNKRLIPDRRHGEHVELLLRVKQQWKGAPQQRFWIRTPRQSAACGYNFRVKRDYLVFLSRDPASNQYTTSLCSLNRTVASSGAHLTALDKAAAAENLVRRDLDK
jgi:hypothetical protein